MGTVSLLHKQEQLPGCPSASAAYGEAPGDTEGDELNEHKLCLSPRCPPDGAAFFETSPPNSSASSSPDTWSPTTVSACCCTDSVTRSSTAAGAVTSSGDGGCMTAPPASSSPSPATVACNLSTQLTTPGARSSDLTATKVPRPSCLIPPKLGDSRAPIAGLPSPPSVIDSKLDVTAPTTGTLQVHANEAGPTGRDHQSREPKQPPLVSVSSSPPLPPPPPSPIRPPAVPSRDSAGSALQKQLQQQQHQVTGAKSPETCTPSPVILLQAQAISVKAPRPIREANPPVTSNPATTAFSSQPFHAHDVQSPLSPSNQLICYPKSYSSSVSASSHLKRDLNAPVYPFLPEYQRQSSLPVATLDPFGIQDGRTVIPWGPRSGHSEEAALNQCNAAGHGTDAVIANCSQSVSDSRRKKEDRHLPVNLINQQTTGQLAAHATTDRNAGSSRQTGLVHPASSSSVEVNPGSTIQGEHSSTKVQQNVVGYVIDQPCSHVDSPHSCSTVAAKAPQAIAAEADTTSSSSPPQGLHAVNWTGAQLRSEQKVHRGDVRVLAPQRSMSTRQNPSNPPRTMMSQLSPTHPSPMWQSSQPLELASAPVQQQQPYHQRRRAANSESLVFLSHSSDIASPVDNDTDLEHATDHCGKPSQKRGGERRQRMTVGGAAAGGRYCGVPRRTSASLCDAVQHQPHHQQPAVTTVAAPPGSSHHPVKSPHLSMSQSVVLLPPGQRPSVLEASTTSPSATTSTTVGMPLTSGWMTSEPEYDGQALDRASGNGRQTSHLMRSHSYRLPTHAHAQQQQLQHALPLDNSCYYYQRSISHTVPLEVYQPPDGGEVCWPPVLVHWHHRRRQVPQLASVGHQRHVDCRNTGSGALYKNGQPHYHSASAIFERLESQPWFHFNLSRAGAERLLKATTVGSFLVRQSETNKAEYSLSIKRDNDVLHMKISHDRMSGQYILGEYSQPYPSVSVMIYRYMHSLLPIRGTTPVLLRFPVSRRCNGPS